NTTARTARRVVANLLRNGIGVNVDDVVVTVRTDIGDAKRHVAHQLLLDGVVPRHDRWSFRVELNPLRLHEGARIRYPWCTEGRQSRTGNDRRRKRRIVEREVVESK